jgi:flagellar hook-basal body complex protein FliE
MNTIQNSQLLQQMRSLQTQATGAPAQGGPMAPDQATSTDKVDFSTVLKQSIESVNTQSQKASQMAAAFERGESGVSLAQVMIEAQKASVGFEAMKRVRNDLVSAYKEIMSMSV